MKIVSWNCCEKFREKYQFILKQEADIYVIQECENPAEYGDEKYKDLFKNGFWTGGIKYKGVGIFSLNPDIKLERLDWPGQDKQYFIPVNVNDELNVVAVWSCKPYCEMFFDYFQDVQNYLNSKVLMIGDFNSNLVLDEHHSSKKSWGTCVELLNEKGLVDVYNDLTGEKEGKEKKPTFFLTRHLDKPFHFDRCVAAKGKVKKFDILTNYQWLSRSDHLPIIVEL